MSRNIFRCSHESVVYKESLLVTVTSVPNPLKRETRFFRVVHSVVVSSAAADAEHALARLVGGPRDGPRRDVEQHARPYSS